MEISTNDKRYVLEIRIKSLNGKKQLISSGEEYFEDKLEDIDSQILVLTNMLKML